VRPPREDAQAAQGNTDEDADGGSGGQTYTVKKGDTLWAIAKALLGDGARYNELWGTNRDKIDNPNLIQPGMVLRIPEAKP